MLLVLYKIPKTCPNGMIIYWKKHDALEVFSAQGERFALLFMSESHVFWQKFRVSNIKPNKKKLKIHFIYRLQKLDRQHSSFLNQLYWTYINSLVPLHNGIIIINLYTPQSISLEYLLSIYHRVGVNYVAQKCIHK